MLARCASWCLASLAVVATVGCVVVDEDRDRDGSSASGGTGGRPAAVGPVARSAAEVWPDEPSSVPVIDRQQIAQACVRSVSCAIAPGDASAFFAVDFCVNQIEWSAERAIPLSGLTRADERAELWVDCVLQTAQDCDAVAACRSGRSVSILCEEAGCRNTGSTVAVTCEGNVATITVDGQTSSRDCARAYATCDTQSSTGCTDRHFTSCAPELATSDRCDGDVRLGCDAAGQVSYHDCGRMGGRCGSVSGGQDCIYSDSPDPACTGATLEPATCIGSALEVCVNGQRVSVAGSDLCM